METKTVDLFVSEMSKDGIAIKVVEVGLSLSKDKPYLETSLDGIITITETNEKWGMEIKCSFSKAGISWDRKQKPKNASTVYTTFDTANL